MTDFVNELTRAEAGFERILCVGSIDDAALEAASGTGSLADGRSTPGDATSGPGVACTCCCN